MTSVPSPRPPSSGNKRGYFALVLVLLVSASNLQAQLELGIRLYEIADYSEALKRFAASDGPTARLYEARSYYHLGEYDLALRSLKDVDVHPSTPLGAELVYTRAVIRYAHGQASAAIADLETIRSTHAEAAELLAGITAYERVDDSLQPPFPNAPRGTILTIGVLLPSEPRTSRAFSVVQGLYQGILMAVDEFNERSPNVKLRLAYASSNQDAAKGFEELRTKHHAVAVIGPLRSEEVSPVAALALEHRIPLFIPLANAYPLMYSNPYVFRFNPTVEDAGMRMAKAAYGQLGLRRIAVFTHPDVESTDDASAFIRTFEALGGQIVMSISDPQFTQLQPTSRRLDTLIVRRPKLPDSLRVDAVYLPITGTEANTVADNLLSAIDSKRLGITVLGNEELGYLDHSANRLERIPTYHTSMLDVSPKTEQLEQFRTRYIARTTIDPNDFSYVGYDVASFVFQILDEVQHPGRLSVWIPKSDLFRGLTSQYHFEGQPTNHWLPVYRLTPDGPVELTSPR